MSTIVKEAQKLIQKHQDLKQRDFLNLDKIAREAEPVKRTLKIQLEAYEGYVIRTKQYITALEMIEAERNKARLI